MIRRQTILDAIDEISREVDDGYGFDYAKWRQYFCELPSIQFATDTNVGTKLGTNLAKVGTDLISRQAAIGIVEFECGEWRGLAITIVKAIEQLPSAQPERKKGKWIYNSPVTMKCDQCGLVIKDWDWNRFKYCPNCCSDMRGERE